MYTISKVPSKLKGPYSPADLPTVEFSNMGLVDLNQSYIELVAAIDNGSSAVGAKEGIYEVYVVGEDNTDGNISYTNSVFLKQLSHTINNETVQSTDDLNILTQNLAQYTRNFEQMKSDNYDNITEFDDTDFTYALNRQEDMWRSIKRSGTTMSTNRSVSLRIPCRDVMSMGRLVVPTDGILHKVKVNIDTSHLEVINFRPYSSVPTQMNFDPVNNGTANPIEAGTEDHPIVSSLAYPEDNWDVFVGQAVNVNFMLGAGPASNKHVIITRITQTGADDVELVFDEPLVTIPGGVNLTDITLISEPMSPQSVKINSLNLVLKSLHPKDKRAKKMAGIKTLMYPEWKLQRFNMDDSTSWNKTFVLDANCTNAIMMTPLTSLISVTDDVLYYRLAID